LGTELHRTGRSGEAADYLYRGLDAAVQCSADGLAETARTELTTAGLRPHPLHTTETDTLTTDERTAATLAAHGRTDHEIAVELDTDEQSAVRLLSAAYRKLGTDRTGLEAALIKPTQGRTP
ncbi:ATP-binding protein, partial [Streptomyces sp. MBT65]|nr:ATP-binding protein [Streptomyces sp. MBT65]